MLYGIQHVRTASVQFPWMMQTGAYGKKRARITLASGVSRDAGRLGARSTTWSIIDRCQNRRREYKQVRIARVVDTLSYAWPTRCYLLSRYVSLLNRTHVVPCESLINYVTCLSQRSYSTSQKFGHAFAAFIRVSHFFFLFPSYHLPCDFLFNLFT